MTQPSGVARRLSFLLIGVNVALRLRDRWFPGESAQLAKVANCAVAVDGPAAGGAR